MVEIIRDLLKSPRWQFLVVLGFAAVAVAVIWASLASLDIDGGHIKPDPESASRYVGAAVLGALGIAVIIFGLIASRTEQEQREADLRRVPVEQIAIDDVRLDRPRTPDPQYFMSGHVTPAKSGVKVWLLRESLAQRRGQFTLSPSHATTEANGHWGQSIIMWRQQFHIHAVVTTEENASFYRWAISAREAAQKLARQLNPGTNTVPDWPPLDSLPNPCISAKRRVDV